MGLKTEKQEYPVAWGPNGILIGFGAAKDLEAGEVYLEIPVNACVTRKSLLQSDLGELITKHPEIFDKHEEDDFSLVIFYMREYMRGSESPWWPSIQITNLSELPLHWSEEEINEF